MLYVAREGINYSYYIQTYSQPCTSTLIILSPSIHTPKTSFPLPIPKPSPCSSVFLPQITSNLLSSNSKWSTTAKSTSHLPQTTLIRDQTMNLTSIVPITPSDRTILPLPFGQTLPQASRLIITFTSTPKRMHNLIS